MSICLQDHLPLYMSNDHYLVSPLFLLVYSQQDERSYQFVHAFQRSRNHFRHHWKSSNFQFFTLDISKAENSVGKGFSAIRTKSYEAFQIEGRLGPNVFASYLQHLQNVVSTSSFTQKSVSSLLWDQQKGYIRNLPFYPFLVCLVFTTLLRACAAHLSMLVFSTEFRMYVTQALRKCSHEIKLVFL